MNAKLLVTVTSQEIVSPPEAPVLLHWSTVALAGAAATLGLALRDRVELRSLVLESVVRVDTLPWGAWLPVLELQVVLGVDPVIDAGLLLLDVGGVVSADWDLGA